MSSIFTMERGLVGDTKLRAYSGILTDPLLPDGAERAPDRVELSAEARSAMAQAPTPADFPKRFGVVFMGTREVPPLVFALVCASLCAMLCGAAEDWAVGMADRVGAARFGGRSAQLGHARENPRFYFAVG